MKKTEKRLSLCRKEDWSAGTLRNLKITDNRLVLDISESIVGMILLPSIDSRQNGFAWDRVIVDAFLPEGSSVEVFGYATDSADPHLMDAVRKTLKDSGASYLEVYQNITARFGEPIGKGRDFIADIRGRYIWLLVMLISGGKEKPYISSVTYRMEGDHMIDYLPSLYSDSRVTRRLLSIFNSIYTDMDRQIDMLPSLLDYESNSDGMLRVLADWMDVDSRGVQTDELRNRIRTAIDDYETMYTPMGIKRSIKRLTGKEPVLIEYADVDPNSDSCPDPVLYRKLFGDDPFSFFVILGSDTFASPDDKVDFLEKMDSLIPAGTGMRLITVKGSVNPENAGSDLSGFISRYAEKMEQEDAAIDIDMVMGGADNE